MARPISKGIKYTTLSVLFFQDRKIRRLQRRCGDAAPVVYIAILCTIYAEGYYIKWDDDLILDLADATRMSEDSIKTIVDGCIEVDLLSREMFEKYGVLTSHGIQKQYQTICEQCKRKNSVEEFSLLVSSEETSGNEQKQGVSSEETQQKVDIPAQNSEKSTQSKVKERKEKKNKENSSSSLSSSSGESEEEKQQQEDIFLEEMFFKNWTDPNIEFRKFLDFNNTGGRVWEKMSPTERQAAFNLWKQKPEQKKHLPDAFLAVWREFVTKLRENKAPRHIWLAAIDDKLNCEIRPDALVLWCWPELRDYIEDPDNLEALLPSLRKMLSGLKLPQLKYHIIQDEHEI